MSSIVRPVILDPTIKFIDAALTATSEDGEAVVENLQVEPLSETWKSTSKSGQNVTVNFGEKTTTNALAFGPHNLTDGATITVKGSDTGAFAGEETILINAEPAFESIWGWGEGGWGEHGWGGFPTAKTGVARR